MNTHSPSVTQCLWLIEQILRKDEERRKRREKERKKVGLRLKKRWCSSKEHFLHPLTEECRVQFSKQEINLFSSIENASLYEIQVINKCSLMVSDCWLCFRAIENLLGLFALANTYVLRGKGLWEGFPFKVWSKPIEANGKKKNSCWLWVQAHIEISLMTTNYLTPDWKLELMNW